jgi:hypothetical protein
MNHVFMFQPRFTPLVEARTKLQTIRPHRKRMPVAGDVLSLRAWTGKPYRSKQRILRDAIVSKVEDIWIYEWGALMMPDAFNPQRLSARELQNVAEADGFKSWADMHTWFHDNHKLPFHGFIIKWT